MIIDGQQRLVTIFVFLSALRNYITEKWPESKKKDEINDLYLMNKYHPDDKYKVVPTQADWDIFSEQTRGKTANETRKGRITRTRKR